MGKEVHRPSIFVFPQSLAFWLIHIPRAGLINILLSLRSRRTQDKIEGLRRDCSPLHNYFFIHEVHPPSLPLTKSSAGEHHSKNYHVTLRSRFSQWVQLTDRPRRWPLAYPFWSLCKYQERKRGKQELGRNCSHGPVKTDLSWIQEQGTDLSTSMRCLLCTLGSTHG